MMSRRVGQPPVLSLRYPSPGATAPGPFWRGSSIMDAVRFPSKEGLGELAVELRPEHAKAWTPNAPKPVWCPCFSVFRLTGSLPRNESGKRSSRASRTEGGDGFSDTHHTFFVKKSLQSAKNSFTTFLQPAIEHRITDSIFYSRSGNPATPGRISRFLVNV
jgi:hypothetical protein